MNWRDERRADREAAARVRREDAASAAEVRIAERAAIAKQQREDERARAEQVQAVREARAQQRRAALAAAKTWAGTRVVELLIYPIALLAFVLAAPAMAVWGRDVYGSALGLLLPGISELAMWAFAVAVLVSRRREPNRPVLWLQVGVWLFAGVAFAANLAHGLERAWESGVVMGLVSIAGVLAHQLTLAAAPRTREQRTAAGVERAAARKVAKVRRAAVRHAVAELAADGTARLVYAPGRYALDARPGRRPRLTTAIVPDLLPEVTPTDWDGELADLLAATSAAAVEPSPEVDSSQDGSPVATFDEPPDLHESTPDRVGAERRRGRSIDELRTALRAAIDAGTVNPESAESIRKTIRCSAARARRLRDEYQRGEA